MLSDLFPLSLVSTTEPLYRHCARPGRPRPSCNITTRVSSSARPWTISLMLPSLMLAPWVFYVAMRELSSTAPAWPVRAWHRQPRRPAARAANCV